MSQMETNNSVTFYEFAGKLSPSLLELCLAKKFFKIKKAKVGSTVQLEALLY